MNTKGDLTMIDNPYGLDIFLEYEGYKQYTVRIRNSAGDLLDKKYLFDYTLTEATAIAKYMADNVYK
jgi:hypothetical protein